MNSYQQLKVSLETSMEMLKQIHHRIYSLTFGVLGISLVVSQIILRISKNPSLFFFSSLWILIAGLPILGLCSSSKNSLFYPFQESVLAYLLGLLMRRPLGIFVYRGNFGSRYKDLRRRFTLQDLRS